MALIKSLALICIITEEIPNEAHFERRKFEKKAVESINQLKNKKISEMEAFWIAPRVSLIYDRNDKFEEQIDINEVAKIKNYTREVLKVTSKSLCLKLFNIDSSISEMPS